MGQTFTDDCFAAGHVGQTDLQNMETNFATLKSMFSGVAAPANLVPGMPWFDTTQKVMKYRNQGDTAWVGVMHGDTSQKIWVYRNAAMDGWAIDAASATDRVLALKGAGGLYNANGGTNAGETWANLKAHIHTGGTHTHTITDTHNHNWYDPKQDTAVDASYTAAGAVQNIAPYSHSTYYGIAVTLSGNCLTGATSEPLGTSNDAAGATGNNTANNTGAQSTADVRPAAALGTLQYLNL